MYWIQSLWNAHISKLQCCVYCWDQNRAATTIPWTLFHVLKITRAVIPSFAKHVWFFAITESTSECGWSQIPTLAATQNLLHFRRLLYFSNQYKVATSHWRLHITSECVSAGATTRVGVRFGTQSETYTLSHVHPHAHVVLPTAPPPPPHAEPFGSEGPFPSFRCVSPRERKAAKASSKLLLPPIESCLVEEHSSTSRLTRTTPRESAFDCVKEFPSLAWAPQYHP